MLLVMFVGSNNLKMSKLSAEKLHNLIPIPSEVVFITPDANLLKNEHLDMKIDIPYRYIEDSEIVKQLGIEHQILKKKDLGWTCKQYMELYLDVLFPNYEYILLFDCDVIANIPLTILSDNKIHLYIERERYEPYFQSMKILLPKLTNFLPYGDSFIADFMLLKSNIIADLRNEMNISFDEWYKIVTNVPYKHVPAYADYETFGTYMYNRIPDELNLIKSSTYNCSDKYTKNWKLSELLSIPDVLRLRMVRDNNIDWEIN